MKRNNINYLSKLVKNVYSRCIVTVLSGRSSPRNNTAVGRGGVLVGPRVPPRVGPAKRDGRKIS